MIIPVQTQYYAMKGLTNLVKVINAIRLKLNRDLKILGLLPTFYDGRIWPGTCSTSCVSLATTTCSAASCAIPSSSASAAGRSADHDVRREQRGRADLSRAAREVVERRGLTSGRRRRVACPKSVSSLAIVSLLSNDSPTRSVGVRIVPVERIDSNPQQPRLAFNQETLDELAASIREHGVLQPILVRPTGENRYQLVAGERRWRAVEQAGLETIPALIEDIDDDTALEISIENLSARTSRLSMKPRCTTAWCASTDTASQTRRQARQGQGLSREPPPTRRCSAGDPGTGVLAQDTLSHAYELMKVEDQEATPAGRPGRPWRADAHQAARQDRGSSFDRLASQTRSASTT